MKALLSLAIALAGAGVYAETATGVVFDDRDGDGVRGDREPGIAGVCVSNGDAVVMTDRDGRYSLPAEGDAVIFLTKPANWNTPVDKKNTPLFYYVHSPKGSPKLRFAGMKATGPLPKEIDFPLVRGKEKTRFGVLLFGDSQPPTAEAVDYYEHEIVEGLVGTKEAFGVTLGDVVWDNLALHPFVAAATAKIGLPWHYVPGNHDRNYDVETEELGYETWKSLYGPRYYSFDEGKAHFVVLEDVMRVKGKSYQPGIGATQLRWLKNDLRFTPRNRLIVLMMHIPLFEGSAERKEILEAIAPYKNTVSFGAHWHTQQFGFLGKAEGWPLAEPHRSVVVGATCGCWWNGELDSVALPMSTNSDGTPQGWIVMDVNGTDYKLRFQASRRPADYQMNVTMPSVLKPEETEGTEVVANVFLASEKSVVEMCVAGGPWVPMKREQRKDPNLERIKALQDAKKLPATGGTMGSGNSSHIWVGKLPALTVGTHLVEVRARDVFGQVVTGRRMIRVR